MLLFVLLERYSSLIDGRDKFFSYKADEAGIGEFYFEPVPPVFENAQLSISIDLVNGIGREAGIFSDSNGTVGLERDEHFFFSLRFAEMNGGRVGCVGVMMTPTQPTRPPFI